MNKSHSKFKLWFDRLLSKSIWEQFLILGVVLVVALGMSYLMLSWSGAEWEKFCDSKNLNKWLLPVYLLIDSNALNNLYIGDVELGAVHGWMLIASSITFIIGAFIFNGAIIGIIVNFIDQRISNYREGRTHYLKSGHYLIMGYDDMVPSIIAHIFNNDKDAFILLLSATESENLREKLRKVFNEMQLRRIIINYGHRTSMDYYKDIHLESAEKVYIVGQRSLPSHDAINVECVDSICTYLERSTITDRPKRITCVFEDLDTYAAFKTSDIFERVENLGIEFMPYNFYAGWAKQVFMRQYYNDFNQLGKEIKYPSVYGNGYTENDTIALTENDNKYAHLVFVGTTNFAVAFAMESAHVLHFPNGDKAKTRITFIDKNADEEKAEFIIRNRHFFEVQEYRYLDLTNEKEEDKKTSRIKDEYVYFKEKYGYANNDANFLDVEFEFIKGDVFSKEVQELIADWAEGHNENQYLSIFLAMGNQRQNFVLGMNMPDAVYNNEVPVFIRQDHSNNFVSNLRDTDEDIRTNNKRNTHYKMSDEKIKKTIQAGRYANIYPFGMNDTAYSANERSLKHAKLINYLYSTMPSGNKFQSLLILNSISDEQIWADANKYWCQLTVALKWSNLYSAYSLRSKLATLHSMRGMKLHDESQDTRPLSDEEVEVIAHVEHNRWNVEKLLMGYRKARKDEDKYAVEDESMKNELKKNKSRFIHHDIRPFDQLDAVQELDREFSRYIPWIIKMTEGK